MKKYLVAFFAVLLFASCSENDNSPVNNNPDQVDPDTGVFTKILETVHDGIFPAYQILYEYTNGKLTRKSYIVGGDVVTYYYEYGYNAAGLLVSEAMIPYTNGSVPTTSAYSYDNIGRISHIAYTRDGEPAGEVTYTYTGNIVTSVDNNGVSGKIYTVNNGLVVKELEEDDVFGDSVFEAQYDGTNVISTNHTYGQSVYTYDTEHNAAILGITDGNGTYKANGALIYGDMYNYTLTDIAANYLISENYTDGAEGQYNFNKVYTYSFSPGGRPLTKTVHMNGELLSEAQYIYEAQ